MANKPQAKAAVDAACAAVKTEIDTILPALSGWNIKDGSISFGPTRMNLILDAEGSSATAEGLVTSITTNLATAGRPVPVVRRSGRREQDGGGDYIEMFSSPARYIIEDFSF